MNTLNTILESMKELRPVAEMDPMVGPVETAVGRRGLQRSAVEKTSQLRLEYRQIFAANSVFMIVTGPSRQAFADLASNEAFECFSAEADDFYRSLVSKVNAQSFGRERTHFLFQVIENALYDRAMELGIGSYNSIQYKSEYSAYVNNAEELLPIVRRAVNEQVGSEIVGLHTIDRLLDRAITKNHSASVTPIVLNCADEALALDLIKNLPSIYKNVFLVSAGKPSKSIASASKDLIQLKTVSEESVGAALQTIRSNIRK